MSLASVLPSLSRSVPLVGCLLLLLSGVSSGCSAVKDELDEKDLEIARLKEQLKLAKRGEGGGHRARRDGAPPQARRADHDAQL